MTRCPCKKSVCRPGTSFFYKVLASLKQLQSQKKYCNGADLDGITKFMDKTYHLNGDIISQVENALCAAECSRFVVKKKNLYALVCPVAALQFTPGPCFKAKLERIQQIFNAKWCEDNKDEMKRSCRSTRRNSYSPTHFMSPTKNNSSTTITRSKTNCKSQAQLKQSENLDDDDTSLRSSLRSYLKSFKLSKCPNSSKNLISSTPSQNSSKESCSYQSFPKKKRRSKTSRPKKKICVSSHSQNTDEDPCNLGATSSEESDSDSLEC